MRYLLLILALYINCSLFAYSNDIIQDRDVNKNKYLIAFFYKEQNDKTQHLQQVFDESKLKIGQSAEFIKINVKDPNHQALIDQYSLRRTPMPFVLVIAPNGAITGGFPSFTEDQLQNAIVSPGTCQILKGLQDRKLVILSLQNSRTANNAAAMQGINDFKADSRFGNAVEIVIINPSDNLEHKFLNTLGVDTNTTQAQTLLIAPPAEVLGKYEGPTTKAQFVNAVQSAASGCCPGGCCPGGCCPGGKCGR